MKPVPHEHISNILWSLPDIAVFPTAEAVAHSFCRVYKHVTEIQLLARLHNGEDMQSELPVDEEPLGLP